MTHGGRAESANGKGIAFSCACALMLALFVLSGKILNACVYSAVAGYFGFAREIATLAGALCFLAIGVAARFAPRLLDVRSITSVAALFCVVQVPLFSIAAAACDPALSSVALALRSLVRNWALSMFALCLLRLGSAKRTAIVVVGGMFIGQVAGSFPLSLSPAAAMGAVSALIMVPLLWSAANSAPAFRTLRECESAAVVELTNPQSFLGASHGLFQCAFLFALAGGFALAFKEIDNAPLTTNAMAALLVALVLFAALVRDERQEDTLFSFSVLLVLAGFLMVPFEMADEGTAANSLINLGEDCFDVLLWLVVASIGRRNPFAALPVFCFARCASQLGTDVGAMAGHGSNALALGNAQLVEAFALAFVFAFFGFLWVRFRAFSFADVISGIERVSVEGLASTSPTNSPETKEDEADSAKASIDDRCKRLAAERGLTARESEIFAMLAKGRNGRFIMEHYVISRNTVKSHIKHIYTKLGVHSQQELINLVEEGERA